MAALALRSAFETLARRLDAAHDPDWVPALVGPKEARAQAEAFLVEIYRERFDASLREFMPWLLTFTDRSGELLAVVGLRPAKNARLFVEQYLDAPAEQVVAASLARPVERDRMIEVGSLAARRPGDARRVILCLTRGLHQAGQQWVLFAATRQLRNAFDRLGLRTVALAPARRERLQPAATDWGRYYDTQPMLLCGDIAAGAAFLEFGTTTSARALLRGTQRLESAGACA